MQEVTALKTTHVCVTGGGPLLQEDVLPLMSKLCDLGHKVSLETSGDLSCKKVDKRVLKVIDIKTPDSGEPNRFNNENLELSGVNTEFKFVICSEADFVWAEKFVEDHGLSQRNTVLYSPSFEDVDKKWLANKMLSVNSSARLQLQMHKFIWSPEQRGV
jgi:7-carboxy-7-deazaguanine synthase